MDTQTFYNEDEKYWYGRESNQNFDPDASVGEVAFLTLIKNANRVTQIYEPDDTQQTSADIAKFTVRIAKYLLKLRLQHDDIIGICASNTKHTGSLALGALLAGIPFSTLDPSFDKEGIKHIYGITKPKIMFCDGNIYDDVKVSLGELGLECPIYTMKDHRKGVKSIDELLVDVGENDLDFVPPKLATGDEQTAAVLCSSGSTGLPKGVCLSHKALKNIVFDFTSNDIILSFSSLYWISGLCTLILGTVTGGCRLVTDKPFTAELMLAMIPKYKVTVLFGPPSQMALLVQCPLVDTTDFSSIRSYLCGGSAIPYTAITKMRNYLKNGDIISGYGMTETCGAISMGIAFQPGSNGKINWKYKVKISDECGNRLGPEETGEVCLKSPFKWNGYYKNAVATVDMYDDEGWLKSGDLGYMSSDGNLFIVDRKKDIYKYKNFHYYPTEIEQVIAEIPGVVEVCVCGIPDPIVTDLPAAAVVKRSDTDLTDEDIYNYVAKRMAHFKHLRGGVYMLDDLPKTASGKNIRKTVRDILQKLHRERINK